MVYSITQTLAVASALSSMAMLAPTADAHQIVLLDKDTKYNPLAFLENQGFETQEDFASWRDKNGYKSLRDFMDKAKYTVTSGADFSCGFTDPKGTPQPIPAGDAMRSTGYTHDGPCEVWLDDTKVLEGDNCHEKFPGKDYTTGGSGTSQQSTPSTETGSNTSNQATPATDAPTSFGSPAARTTDAPSTPTTTAPPSFGFGSPAAQTPTSGRPGERLPRGGSVACASNRGWI
ncbi:hypothetical protein PHYSODRAFT_341596 [Phytophthora sojae]|uniref:Uncharacterized protein n=1 Tax=Phytophthora sojae (strain P6497) TaxID=1094619 RepID=G5ADS7_PHYSP|nr:hypothetical protein PHYSODRAFT_341596 [Phytophthora sojae]EGZ06330.1 hypothetical protein PHYSODRAFT_341596 [Phytophthora sojae]|eukprot:XP_009538227.1 hypothetical protein PHYSODRAFT_341596 [Phytophthora sojae]